MNAKPKRRRFLWEYYLPYPPAKVWRALHEPELLAKWVTAKDTRPLVGHRFNFRAEPTPWWDGIVYCEVLEIDLHKRLRHQRSQRFESSTHLRELRQPG